MLSDVWKNRLRALIFIFIISAVTGCVPEPSPVSTEIFSADYYILKRHVEADYQRLEKFGTSDNATTAATASLILGYYHLRDGATDKAAPLITKYYNDKNLDGYMLNMGELWMMELALAEKKTDEAVKYAESIYNKVGEKDTNSALGTYCTITKLYPAKGESPYSCVSQRLQAFGIGDSKGAVFSMDKLPDQLNILVTGTGSMLERAGGIYFHLKQHNLNHKIKTSPMYIDGEWDFWVDLDRGYLSGHGVNISFKPDMVYYINRMEHFIPLNNCNNIILGVNNRNRLAVTELKNRLTAENKRLEVYIVDIKDDVLGRSIRNTLGPIGNNKFCAVGIGTEREIYNFLPIVRQYVTRPLSQTVYAVTEMETGVYYKDPYLTYYKNSYLYPLIESDLSAESRDFSEKYMEFAGKEPSEDVFIGYDIMHFIYKHSKKGKNSDEPYVSNIRVFHSDSAVRDIKLFNITTKGAIEPVTLKIDENKLYREIKPQKDEEKAEAGKKDEKK